MISIRYPIAGTHYAHHLHSHGTSPEYSYDDYGSGWSAIREEDKRQRVRRLVWAEMMIARLLKRLLLG